MPIVLEPVGHVRSSRSEPVDDGWDSVPARIELDPERFGAEALAGLEAFSHAVVVTHFHRADPVREERGARHPRGNLAWPRVGIFAQRGKDRPNRLGVTVCRILGVEGTMLHVAGLDAIDGTPVLDIKPWMEGFAPRGERREPPWAAELMRGYW